MCFPAPTVRSLPLALFTRGRSASAVLQLIGPKEFLLQLGSVFRDELLRVRLFNFAGEILIKKKKSSDWICAAKNVLSFFFSSSGAFGSASGIGSAAGALK